MHNCPERIRGKESHIGFEPALDAFKRAIETLPERRENKHSEKDPILEPHYKLVSVVHKLVISGRLTVRVKRRNMDYNANILQAEGGSEALSATPYARKTLPVKDQEEWEGYMLQTLKVLRSADKSNWHHRMVLRVSILKLPKYLNLILINYRPHIRSMMMPRMN